MVIGGERAGRQLDALQTLLVAAHQLVDRLADPLVDRVLTAFLTLPAGDREPILRVLEKDAAWRAIIGETAVASGIDVRPNPHASLYVHVLTPPEAAAPMARDADVIRRGIETFVRLFPLLFQEGVHAHWSAAAREIIAAADAELRALGARLAREVLALIAEADADPPS